MNKDNSMIAENIRSIRLNKGWSQAFVANQLQLSIRTISRAENGWGCSDRTLKLLANMYHVPVSRFYELKETDETRYLDIVPANVIAGMMVNNKFFCGSHIENGLQYENILILLDGSYKYLNSSSVRIIRVYERAPEWANDYLRNLEMANFFYDKPIKIGQNGGVCYAQ